MAALGLQRVLGPGFETGRVGAPQAIVQ